MTRLTIADCCDPPSQIGPPDVLRCCRRGSQHDLFLIAEFVASHAWRHVASRNRPGAKFVLRDAETDSAKVESRRMAPNPLWRSGFRAASLGVFARKERRNRRPTSARLDAWLRHSSPGAALCVLHNRLIIECHLRASRGRGANARLLGAQQSSSHVVKER